MFCKDQVEANLKDVHVSKKLKQKTESKMIKEFRGEDQTEQEISIERLQQLLQTIESGQEVELKPHEQALFQKYIRANQHVWTPWWVKRETI